MRSIRSSRAVRTLRIRTVGDERWASTRFRVLAHRPALEAAGYHATVRFSRVGRIGRALDLVGDLTSVRPVETLLVHRRTYPRLLAGGLRRTARRLVFDMDDAVDMPPPSRATDGRERERYRARFEGTVREFDLVLCGNRELASRLPHDRFEILPTPIDTVRFSPDRVVGPCGPTLGWVGHSDNLGYLERLCEPLRELARRHAGLRLIVVADRPPRLDSLRVEYRCWRLDREVSCFDGIGVGLMPLDDNAWTRGKCAFKAIQYLALGIPAVASPVGMSEDVVRDGITGFVAADHRQWVACVDRLLRRPDLARQLGAEGRRLVERSYSLEVISGRLVKLLDSLSPRIG